MTVISEERLQRVKSDFGDHLLKPELAFLRETQRLFQAALNSGKGFGIVVEIVAAKLHGFLNKTNSNRIRLAFDAQSFKETFDADSARILVADAALTEGEACFSKDVIDAIEFVICNGIGFGLIAGALSHDLNEILAKQCYEDALFSPKVSGWADYHRAQIGVSGSEENS